MTKSIVTADEIKSVQILEKDAKKHLTIESDKDVVAAADILVRAKIRYDEVEETRKHYVKPAQETIKRINDDAKKVTEPLAELQSLLRPAIKDYVIKRKNELNSIAKDLQKETGDKSLVLTNGVDRIFTEDGEIRFKKSIDMKITNKNLIPEKYLVIDEKAIIADLKAGLKEDENFKIPGVKVVEDLTPSVYKITE